jgi:hypothetical protein
VQVVSVQVLSFLTEHTGVLTLAWKLEQELVLVNLVVSRIKAKKNKKSMWTPGVHMLFVCHFFLFVYNVTKV